MRITEMRQTSQERFTLTFDNGTQMKTTLTVITDRFIHSGMELSADDYECLRRASAYSLCQAHAMRLINMQAMSKKGMKDKLIQKGEDPDLAQEAAEWLESMGLINDESFAGMVVRHYAAKGYGIGRIRNELYRHGVPKEFWESAFSEMPVQNDKIDKFVRARLTDPSDPRQIKKIADGLARRGYSWSDIKEALERFKADTEDISCTEQ